MVVLIEQYKSKTYVNSINIIDYIYSIIMSQSWRKYGGINQMDKTNNITVKSLVTDTFTIREALANDFEIRGNLTVSQSATIQGDQTVNGTSNLQILDVSQNLSMNGGDLILNKDGFDGNGFFLTASGDFLGVNKRNPEATVDIYGRSLATLNVETTQPHNTNILARNNTGNKIELDVSGNDKASIFLYNRDPNGQPIEFNSVFDANTNQNTVYLEHTDKTEIRSDVAITGQNGLTMTTENSQLGLVIGENSSSNGKSAGYITTKSAVQKLPAQTFLDGTGETSNYDNHIGFNTQSPDENFVVSINGPTQVSNSNSFQIGSFDFLMNELNYSTAKTHALIVGEPTVDGSFVALRLNGNTGWSQSFLDTSVTDLIGTSNIFTSAHCLDNDRSILVSQSDSGSGFILFSNDGASTYKRVLGVGGNFTSVYAHNSHVLIGSSSAPYLQTFTMDFDSSVDVDAGSTTSTTSYSGGTVRKMSGYNNDVWFIDDQSIYRIDLSSNTPTPSVVHSGTYTNLRIINSDLAIAIGSTNIAYSTNGGSVWTNVGITMGTNAQFYDGYILDASRSVVVGSDASGGAVFFTIDGFVTYGKMTADDLGLTNLSSIVFKAVYMINANSFVFIYEESNQIGGKILQLFSPNILNQANSDLLNVYGNVKVTGNIVMDELGEISSTKDTLYIGTGITTQIDHISANTLDVSGVSTLTQLEVLETSVFRNGITIESSNNVVTEHITIQGTMDVCGNTVLSSTNIGTANVSGNLTVGETFTVTGIDIEKGLLLQW